MWWVLAIGNLQIDLFDICDWFVCRKFVGLLEPRVVYTLYHLTFLCLVYFLPLLTLILTYSRVISIIKRFFPFENLHPA